MATTVADQMVETLAAAGPTPRGYDAPQTAAMLAAMNGAEETR